MANRKRQFVSLALLLAIVAVFLLWYTPVSDRNADLEVEVADLQRQLDRLQEAGLEEAPTDAEGVSANTEIDERLVAAAIPDKFDQDEILEQMSMLTKNNALTLESISFSRGNTDTEFISSVNMSVSITGGFFNFLEFLRDLESQNRFYVVENFSLSLSEEQPIQVSFSANIAVYHS